MKLLIATHNPDKLAEIRAVFRLPGLVITSALDYPDLPEVLEDGETLEENAVKKAVSLATATGLWALADDTGLEVDALDGAPGISSARHAGEWATYLDNVNKLLAELRDVVNRSARFHTVISLSDPRGKTACVEGEIRGSITKSRRGDHGFGYDPVFLPDGYDKTFAEMMAEEKNAISHRARALQQARNRWGGLLATEPARFPLTADPGGYLP